MTTATHFCPSCGQPMDTIVCTFDFPTYTKHVVQVTCYQVGCPFKTFTLSPDTANDTGILRDTYHVTKQFDIYTGEQSNE